MRDDLCILLVANNVECRIVDGYKRKSPKYCELSCTCGRSEHAFRRSAPFVNALDILDMAFPTKAAYSGGSSETLEQ